LFLKYLAKLTNFQFSCSFDNIVTIVAIYRQHCLLLGKYEQEVILLVKQFYGNNAKLKKKLPDNLLGYLV
jgi:hypothetical protein